MDDKEILSLYRARNQDAIAQTAKKYGRYCKKIAFGILRIREDSEECVNDTYLRAWNAIPPQSPKRLSAFLGRITRNLALDRLEHLSAQKRGGGQTMLALDELQECIPASECIERAVSDAQLSEVLERFLEALPTEKRKIFLQRYWYLLSVKEIAENLSVGESKVKMTLSRTRTALKQYLEKEGIRL